MNNITKKDVNYLNPTRSFIIKIQYLGLVES